MINHTANERMNGGDPDLCLEMIALVIKDSFDSTFSLLHPFVRTS